MARIWTGEVWVLSSIGSSPESLMKKVSCMARAGCSGGMFSASKLWNSSSISGPSATAKPICEKMAVISSRPCCTGCNAPQVAVRPGNVTSIRSASIRVALAFTASSASLCSSAVANAALVRFTCWPITGRSAGGNLPTPLSTSVNAPFLPKYWTRNCCRSLRFPAAENAASASACNASSRTFSESIPLIIPYPFLSPRRHRDTK